MPSSSALTSDRLHPAPAARPSIHPRKRQEILRGQTEFERSLAVLEQFFGHSQGQSREHRQPQ